MFIICKTYTRTNLCVPSPGPALLPRKPGMWACPSGPIEPGRILGRALRVCIPNTPNILKGIVDVCRRGYRCSLFVVTLDCLFSCRRLQGPRMSCGGKPCRKRICTRKRSHSRNMSFLLLRLLPYCEARVQFQLSLKGSLADEVSARRTYTRLGSFTTAAFHFKVRSLPCMQGPLVQRV